MEQVNRAASSGTSFVGLYILLALPTYVLPYFGSNSIVMNFAYLATGGGGLVLLLIHVALLVGLCVLARARGRTVGKPWLVLFPIGAAIFDIVPILSLIPLVPTLFHVCAMALGSSDVRRDPEDVFS